MEIMATEIPDTQCNGNGDGRVSKELNPMANEWDPVHNGSPVEEKSLYLTFSNGYPLREYQIFNFFTRLYGACVDKVYVHRSIGTRKNGRPLSPMHGRVVFTTCAVPAAVLDGASEKKFVVCGREMRCKKYKSRDD